MRSFCRKTCVHKIPRFGGGGVFWVWGGGGSADFIFMGARIFLNYGRAVDCKNMFERNRRLTPPDLLGVPKPGCFKPSGPEKGVITKGVFSLEKSLESLNSLESLENGRNLLSFPQSENSLEALDSLNSLESPENGLFWKDPFSKRPLFPNPKPIVVCHFYAEVLFFCTLLPNCIRAPLRSFACFSIRPRLEWSHVEISEP